MDTKAPEQPVSSEQLFIDFIETKYEEVETLEAGIITTTSIIDYADLHQLPYHRHQVNDMLIGMQIKHESITGSIDKVWYLKQL